MARSIESIFTIDRRYIFLVIFVIILGSLLVPFTLPVRSTKVVDVAFDAIERSAMKRADPATGARRGLVLMSWDFDPQSAPELEPSARAMVRHIFARGGRVVVVTSLVAGVDLHRRILAGCAQEFGAVEGEDFAYLGYVPTDPDLQIIAMGQNFAEAYPRDVRGQDLRAMPATRDIQTFRDVDYVVEITGTGLIGYWITYAQGMYNVSLGAVVTGVVAPELYNYVDSGQLTGLLGGLVAGAQYEQRLKNEGGNLVRLFAPTDFVRLRMSDVCRRLIAPDRPRALERIWQTLGTRPGAPTTRPTTAWATQIDAGPTPVQEAIVQTAKAGYNQLTELQMSQLAGAFNRAILTDSVPAEDLQRVESTLGEGVSTLLHSRADLSARRAQVLRRLYLEGLFPDSVRKAQDEGRAVKWMTPQSIAHLALIAALLFGNIVYLWGRARADRQHQA